MAEWEPSCMSPDEWRDWRADVAVAQPGHFGAIVGIIP